MKFRMLDTKRLIDINKLRSCSSPRLFASGRDARDPEGIISDDIFGMSRQDRKSTFGYIDLKMHYIQPHVYHHILKRMCSDAIAAVTGLKKFRIVNGWFVEDPEEGWTGISELYKHWNELNWDNSKSVNDDSIKFLKLASREDIFTRYIVVTPPGYRDVMSGTRSDRIPEVNTIYTQIIRLADAQAEGGGGFLGRMNSLQTKTQTKLQELLVALYLHHANLVNGKGGLVRKYLLGKSVSYGTRAVISAPTYNHETIHDSMVDIEHAAIPMSQCCATFKPFIKAWIINFFTREIITNPNIVQFANAAGDGLVGAIHSPDSQFSDKVVDDIIYNYVRNPDSRFTPIIVKIQLPNRKQLATATMVIRGKKFIQGNSVVDLKRPMTITDIIYLACVDACEDKRYMMISRYPVGTDKNIFFNLIRVQSTKKHVKVIFNGKEYKFYPDIDLSTPLDRVGVSFVDTCVYSNSMLKGMDADYDGDQVSLRGLWSDEANAEAAKIMSQKITALNIAGGTTRSVDREVVNSLYELTKIGRIPGKRISAEDSARYLRLTPDQFTLSLITEMLADTAGPVSNKSMATTIQSKHKTWDTITIPANYFYNNHAGMTITIGRFLFMKYVLDGSSIIKDTGIIDTVINNTQLSTIDANVGNLLLNDIIDRKQFNAYIDRRDTLGYWLNGMLAHTISLTMSKPIALVDIRKAELLKKYAVELAAHDLETMSKIEDELKEYARELLKDDPGMDLYLSGDLNFDNNYKNNSILKGPVRNRITGEYDFIDTSYMDGLKVSDIPAHANTIVSAAFPSAIQTAPAGYLGKQLLSLLQMAEADEPGTDCGSLNPIPITVTKLNVKDLAYSYFLNASNELVLLEPENASKYIGKTLRFRSPMSCVNEKFCSKCMGELIYKLGIRKVGLFAVQLSHSNLNLALKSKHDQNISGSYLDPDNIIVDI